MRGASSGKARFGEPGELPIVEEGEAMGEATDRFTGVERATQEGVGNKPDLPGVRATMTAEAQERQKSRAIGEFDVVG